MHLYNAGVAVQWKNKPNLRLINSGTGVKLLSKIQEDACFVGFNKHYFHISKVQVVLIEQHECH